MESNKETGATTFVSSPKIELSDFIENEPPEVIEAKQLALRYRMPFIDLLPPDQESPIDYEELAKIPVELMLRNQFVPLRRENGKLHIAMADPTDLDRLDELAGALRTRIVPAVATAGAIDVVLRKGDQTQRVLQEAASGFKISILKETEQGDEVLDLDRLASDADMSPIIKLVDTILYNAMESRASDIHIETRERDVQVKFRIDGALYAKVDPIDIAFHQTLISRIKVMSELDIAERRIPQDGRFRVRYKGRTVDFRVSIIPSVHGENCVIRILDKEQINESFKNLNLDVVGFDAEDLRRFRVYTKEPYGMVLVTGPTGSGKTTTLYGALNEIRNDEDKIITIEDPVEYQLHGIMQIPVNEKKGLTFARGLRSILRHDPDKIMVGEIRDEETAQIAIQSALTGHLVFTTVHANNVFDVVSRFVHMGVDSHGFVSALSAVLAQRLVRIVCEQCSETYLPARELLDASRVSVVLSASFKFRKGRGCKHCRGTGYHGRKAVGELMVLNDEIREAIVSRVPVRQLKELARQAGVQLIRSSALDLVRRGLTTIEEVNRVTIMA